jgi:hypothetical protein
MAINSAPTQKKSIAVKIKIKARNKMENKLFFEKITPKAAIKISVYNVVRKISRTVMLFDCRVFIYVIALCFAESFSKALVNNHRLVCKCNPGSKACNMMKLMKK